MIGYIKGTVIELAQDYLLIDTGSADAGLGYVVHVNQRLLSGAPLTGTKLALFVVTMVREDAITLYGFESIQERAWFKLLTNVQGVGAKAALAILAVLSTDELSLSIEVKDKTALTRAAGVGPKLAARIVNELNGKTPKNLPEGTLPLDGQKSPVAESSLIEDAVITLTQLGYGRSEAYEAIKKAQAQLEDNSSLEELIRDALKGMAR